MHNRLFHRIENFEKDQIFWCKDCDSRQVSSSDKSTGVFFGIFGTKVFFHWDKGRHVSPGKCSPGTDYIQACFALCPDCLSFRRLDFPGQPTTFSEKNLSEWLWIRPEDQSFEAS